METSDATYPACCPSRCSATKAPRNRSISGSGCGSLAHLLIAKACQQVSLDRASLKGDPVDVLRR